MKGCEVKDMSKVEENKILNTVIGSTILIIVVVIVMAGVPMWTLWNDRQKALQEYEQVKRSNRLNELTEKSKLRAAEATAKRLELMAKLRAKYPGVMKEVEAD